LSDWLVASMRARQPIRVFDDVLFSPLSLETLARLIGLVIARGTRGVFNLGTRAGMSKAQFAMRLAAHLGLPTDGVARGTTADMKFNARRPRDMRMDCARFERTFQITLPTLESEIALMKECYAHEN
jgi:dTDP-4-dehydrorhamnose reductase